MTPGGRSLRRLAGAAGGKVAAAAAMLVAVAAIVVAAGGGGLFGPLGSLISGAGARSAVERAGGVSAGADAGAIVAAPVAGAMPGVRGAPGGRRGGRDRGGRRRDGARRPAPRGPAPRFPGGPGPLGPAGGIGRPPGVDPGRPEPDRRRAVDAVRDTVAEASRNAPEPARPVVDEVDRLLGGLADACRQGPLCP